MDFMKAINHIKDFAKKHKNSIPIISLIISAFLWFIGLFNVNKAQKKDDEAKRILDEAIKKCEENERKTTEVLEKLGKLKKDVCDTYPRLINALETINKSHKGLQRNIKRYEFSKINHDELIEISNLVKVAFESTGGTASGVLVGMAAFGVKAVALTPGAFLGGVVICAKGANMLKNSNENMRKANEAKKTAERLEEYYSELRGAAESLYQSMGELYGVYMEYLPKLEETAVNMAKRKRFTKEEELIIKNISRIIKLLNRMCKVELVLKPKKEEEIETVNTKEVNRIVKESRELIASI